MENYEFPQVDEVLDVDTEEPKLEDKKVGPLDGLVKFFEEEQAKIDARGFADIFKDATHGFFKIISSRLGEDNVNFTPTDVSFGDGYFIFSMGTNSVVHFHVEEAPGWLFGLWWASQEDKTNETEEKVYYRDRIEFDFFAQYEDEIDKFKPTASMWAKSGIYWLEKEDNDWDLLDCANIVKFIIEHPYLAWYRDMHYTNFNYEHIPEDFAEREYRRYVLKKEEEKRIKMINDQAMIDALKYVAGPMLEDGTAIILDSGANCSPRYELCILNKEDPEKDGVYYLWDSEDNEAIKDKAYFDKVKQECKQRAHLADVYWSEFVVSEHFVYRSPEDFEELKQYSIDNKKDE